MKVTEIEYFSLESFLQLSDIIQFKSNAKTEENPVLDDHQNKVIII